MGKLTEFEKAWGKMLPDARTKYLQKQTDREIRTQQRLGKAHQEVYSEKEKTRRAGKSLSHPISKQRADTAESHTKAYATASKAQLLGARVDAVQTGVKLWDSKSGIIFWLILILILIGPGINSIFIVLQAMNLWYWLGAIVLGLFAWRNIG